MVVIMWSVWICPGGSKQIKVNQKPYESTDVPPAKVIHGHFNYSLLRKKLNIDPGVPVITWLRHPVERVISNYYYLCERLMSELDEQSKGLNILSKMMRSLDEYAEGQVNRNRMTKFLDGTSLDELAFVGIVEDFDNEVERLATVLNWKDFRVKRVNRTKEKPMVDASIRKKIEELNKEDMELYQTVLNKRTLIS